MAPKVLYVHLFFGENFNIIGNKQNTQLGTYHL